MSKENNEYSDLEVSYLALAELKPYANNPRTHSTRQIKQIADSIKTFGFTNPVLVDDTNGIIAGHGRVKAAELLGLVSVPTICLSHMSEAQKRAYIIADNKLAEKAGWDKDLLKIEFEYLSSLDLDFDLTVTGFETPEIDIFLAGAQEEETLEDIPLPPKTPVSKPGDIWLIGPHKIICGDATKAETYSALLGEEKASLVFTDPPYNVPIEGHVCGKGSVKHAEFQMASGEMSQEEFTAFLKRIFDHLVAYSSDGSIHYICMDWRHMREILDASRTYTELKNVCVWNKTNGGMGSLYRSKHEFIFVFKNGRSPHVNNIQLGEFGRYRTNVWDFAGVNTFRKDRMDDLAAHPTVKPVPLVAEAILDCSNRGDIILDCFGGSGTTLLAAAQEGRIARIIEIDPAYVDVTVKRAQERLVLEAINAESGQSFAEVAAMRGGDHG